MKYKKYNKLLSALFLILLVSTLFQINSSANEQLFNKTQLIQIDLEVKDPSDDNWKDKISRPPVSTELKFRNTISGSGNFVTVSITFPEMLSYVDGSATPSPDDHGINSDGLEYILWIITDFENPSLTFKAKTIKDEDGVVKADAVTLVNHIEDTLEIGSGCCFPEGTKITMADGFLKNIEDIKVGEKVLSYDIENDEFMSWRVKMIGKPVHPIMTINDGLVQATIDHPFYVKKTDGIKGWAAYDPDVATTAIIYEGEVFKLDVGDQVYSSEDEWITIYNIEYNPEPVQTYNLLSFSGTQNYFANGVLVYEEHPPQCITDYLLDLIGDKYPQIESLIRNSIFFENIYQYLP